MSESVCSVCGLGWESHGSPNPSLEDCIGLLRQELSKWTNLFHEATSVYFVDRDCAWSKPSKTVPQAVKR